MNAPSETLGTVRQITASGTANAYKAAMNRRTPRGTAMRTRLLIVLAIFVGGGPLTAEITWHESLDEAKTVSAEKPVVLYFTDEACVWCRRLESSTFPSEEVLAVAEKFLFVKLDVD